MVFIKQSYMLQENNQMLHMRTCGGACEGPYSNAF